MTIKEAGALDEKEIDRMRKDAESHAEEDRRQFELAEARNKANQLVYQLEKTMKENDEKLSSADKEPMQRAIDKVNAAVKTDDLGAIKSSTSELESASQALSKVLYEKAASTGAGAGSAGGSRDASSADDDAIDAEFEVKDK